VNSLHARAGQQANPARGEVHINDKFIIRPA
jgi:hypothetical protein